MKIIVDKLPKSCENCIFYEFDLDYDMEWCGAQKEREYLPYKENQESRLIEKCELIESRKCEKGEKMNNQAIMLKCVHKILRIAKEHATETGEPLEKEVDNIMEELQRKMKNEVVKWG